MTEVKHTLAYIVAALMIVSALIVAAPASAQQTNFAPAYPSSSAATSYVRLYNAAATPGSFTVALRTAGSSTVVASWTGTVAPRASTAIKIADIETQNRVTPAATTYSVAVTADVEGFAQHVVFNAGDRSWMNFSNCGGPSTDTKTVLNVHDASQISASILVLHNTGSAATAATITIVDAATGQSLNTWTSPTIIAGSFTAPIGAAQILADARIPTAQRPYVTLILNDAFTGYAQHLVTAVGSGVTNDMTAKCALSAVSAGA